MIDIHNPYQLCTWESPSECEECPIAGKLKCRFRRSDLSHFIGVIATFVLPSIIGMIQGEYAWYILGWIGFWIFFFEIWEIRILCSHCPFYAEKGRTLHCTANFGSLKLWNYHPEPISRSEKIQLLIGVGISSGYPFPFLLLSGQVWYALIALWALVMSFWTLRKYVCSACVNFSCILNRVPSEIVDAYLERNPAMNRAWRKAG